jgi:hypothetical protein
MADNFSEKKYPRLALPTGKIRIPKFLYISLIVLVVLILIVGGLYFYLKNSKSIINNVFKGMGNNIGKTGSSIVYTATSSSMSTKQTIKSSNLEIAKETVNWLNTQKNENIEYDIGCECGDESCSFCKEKIYSPRLFSFVLWGKFKYAEKTGDYQNIIDEIKTFQPNLEHGLQYGSWNCKLIYDVWKSNRLSDDIKNQVKNICIKSQYEFGENLRLPDDIDKKLLDNMEKIKNSQSITVENNGISVEDFYKDAFLVSEMVTRVLWKPDISAVNLENNYTETDLAKIYFDKVLAVYDSNKERGLKEDALLGIASIDMYRLTKNNKYLDFAKYLFSLKREVVKSAYTLTYKALFIRELGLITQDKSYDQELKSVIDEIKNSSIGKESQLGAFKSSNGYYVLENSLIVGLLSSI